MSRGVADCIVEVGDSIDEVTDVSIEVVDINDEVADVSVEVRDINDEVADVSIEVRDINDEVADIIDDVVDMNDEVADLNDDVNDVIDEVIDIIDGTIVAGRVGNGTRGPVPAVIGRGPFPQRRGTTWRGRERTVAPGKRCAPGAAQAVPDALRIPPPSGRIHRDGMPSHARCVGRRIDGPLLCTRGSPTASMVRNPSRGPGPRYAASREAASWPTRITLCDACTVAGPPGPVC